MLLVFGQMKKRIWKFILENKQSLAQADIHCHTRGGKKNVKTVKRSKFRGAISCFLVCFLCTKYITTSMAIMQRASKSFGADSHRCREKSCLSSALTPCRILTGMKATCQVATWRKNHPRICKSMSKLCLCFSCTSKCPGFVIEAASLECPDPTYRVVASAGDTQFRGFSAETLTASKRWLGVFWCFQMVQ